MPNRVSSSGQEGRPGSVLVSGVDGWIPGITLLSALWEVIHQSQGAYGQPEQLSEAPCGTPAGTKQLQEDMNAGQVL